MKNLLLQFLKGRNPLWIIGSTLYIAQGAPNYEKLCQRFAKGRDIEGRSKLE